MPKKKEKSLTLIAKEEGAFLKLYEVVKENIFKPAAMALPSQDQLSRRMKLFIEAKNKGILKAEDNLD